MFALKIISYYVEIRKLLFCFTLAFDCLFQIFKLGVSLNTNTFKQQQKNLSLLSFLHSSHLPLCVPSQSTDISVSRPSEVMRAVIDQLFQQEMRGHLSEACLNSDLYGYRVVPGQPFTWRAELRCLPKPTWVIFPDQVLISEVFVARELVNVQRNMSVFFVCFEIIAVLSLHTQFVLLMLKTCQRLVEV